MPIKLVWLFPNLSQTVSKLLHVYNNVTFNSAASFVCKYFVLFIFHISNCETGESSAFSVFVLEWHSRKPIICFKDILRLFISSAIHIQLELAAMAAHLSYKSTNGIITFCALNPLQLLGEKNNSTECSVSGRMQICTAQHMITSPSFDFDLRGSQAASLGHFLIHR